MEKNNKILVIDDEEHIISLVKICLKDEDFEISSAQNSKIALAKVKKEKPALVIADVVLPGTSDGFELCRKIKETDPQIKVVLLTAKGNELDKEKGRQAGADKYITKPFSPLKLLAEIKSLI